MARKTYNRRFKKNGLSFITMDVLKQDKKNEDQKYYLTVKSGNTFKIVYDKITFEIPKFKTIHEAQFWALCNTDFIITM